MYKYIKHSFSTSLASSSIDQIENESQTKSVMESAVDEGIHLPPQYHNLFSRC